MPGRFPFKRLSKYPHMKPEDVKVWDRLIASTPGFFETVDYDVAVGQGAPQNPDLPPEIQADGKILTQKKVDAVGYLGQNVYVVEVKPIADMRALGQILTYTALFTADHPELENVFPMIVCGSVERELMPQFERHGILVEIA